MINYDDFHSKFVDQFDMNEFKQALGPDYSDELLLYPLFYRQQVIRRVSEFTKLIDITDFKEYPAGSMLHLLDDNFLMNKPIVFVPEVQGWSMTREPYRKFMYHVTEPPEKRWVTDYEDFVLPTPGVITTLANYRRRHQQFLRTCNTMKDMPNPNRKQVQSICSYHTLYRARIYGLLRNMRRFQYIFAQLLNHIATMPDRLHFIPIPVGNKQFDRNEFLRTFKAYTRATVKYEDDNWYLFVMHLLGFMHGEKTQSIFENIPKNMWDKIHFVLYSKRKVIIYRLDHLKEFNGENDVIIIRTINHLNSLAESGIEQSTISYADVPAKIDTVEDKSLPDVEPDTPFEERPNVTVTPQITPSVAPVQSIPVLPVVKSFTSTATTDEPESEEPKPVEPKKVETPAKPEPKPAVKKPLSKPAVSIQESADKVAAIEEELESNLILKVDGVTIDKKWLEIPHDIEDDYHNAPEFVKPVPKTEQKEFNAALVVDIDKKAREQIESHPELTTAQRTRAEKLATAYKSVKFDGENLDTILKDTPDDSINENTLDFLAGDVEDPSMLSSSVTSFEKDYMSKLFKRDLVSELVSFNRVGMFLKDLQVEDASDALNSATKYVAKYEDIHHKEHTIRFTLPNVDDRGYCYINGTLKVLKKQRVPNPICKVSKTRVTLNSDYNKYLVERNTTVAHSFIYYFDRILSAGGEKVRATLGTHNYVNQLIPYEYTAIAGKYSKILIRTMEEEWTLLFNFRNWANEFEDAVKLSEEETNTIRSKMDSLKATPFGVSKDHRVLLLKLDGSVVVVNLATETNEKETTIIDFLCDTLRLNLSNLNEWTDFKLLNKSVPTIFALCYRFGLSHILNYTDTKYQIYDKNTRFKRKQSDVIIRFADKTLVIPRVPLVNSLLFAGLNNYDLRKVNIADMDNRDIYFELIQSKKMSVHNLKGIDNFFDYFVDPITADVLHQMGEPIDPKDLLIRATQLLSTEDHKPASSSVNFRFRSYERINAAVYKVLSRAHATFKHKAIGASNKFSIADYEIKQLVVQDQLMENVDTINPINDIKYQCEYSHAGFGGRQSIDTFMVDDRQFPKDAIGIISEATVDSSKTAYAASLTMDPTIMNMRGLTVTVPPKDLAPTQLLSPTAVLVPAVTQDDGKRCNFVNIHLSHYLPTKDMDVYRVRTSYEKVVAHRARLPFAYTAEGDGVIESIDDTAKILVVKYKTGKTVAINFGDDYTNNGGGGFYCTQNIVINNFKQGDKVKRGDVVIYNERFFKPDPYSKQIDWCMGAEALVACIENNATLDDGNAISKSLADKLEFNPVHIRDVVIKKTTTIHKYAGIGSRVNNTDPLMIFDQSEMDDGMFGKLEGEAVDLLAKLNRQTPKAKFTGTIVRIEAYYKCPMEEMAPGLRGICGMIAKQKLLKAKAAVGSSNAKSFVPQLQIKYTDRIGTTDLDDETVILRFYTQQSMQSANGDKIEFGGPFKSVTAMVQDHDWDTEDGSLKVQALFSTIGQMNRICNSPTITGMTARVIEKVEEDILKLYFEK